MAVVWMALVKTEFVELAKTEFSVLESVELVKTEFSVLESVELVKTEFSVLESVELVKTELVAMESEAPVLVTVEMESVLVLTVSALAVEPTFQALTLVPNPNLVRQ